jgi:hypothetical protein
MFTILSTEEVGFFGVGPPPVLFTSFLYSVKFDLDLDVIFLHLSLTSFSVLGATPKALILIMINFTHMVNNKVIMRLNLII